MKKLKNIVVWILLNGFMGWLVYVVLFTPLSENAGLVRLTKFLLWGWSLLAWPLMLVAIAANATFKPGNKLSAIPPQVRSVPNKLSHAYDIVLVGILVYGGWIFTAILWLGHAFAQAITVSALECLAEKQAKATAKT